MSADARSRGEFQAGLPASSTPSGWGALTVADIDGHYDLLTHNLVMGYLATVDRETH